MGLVGCLRFIRCTPSNGYFTKGKLQVSCRTWFRKVSTMSQTSPPILSIHPIRALVDEKFKVLVKNLPPGSPVTLHSLHHSEDKDYWEAYGHYTSNHRGTVSAEEDLSFGGTYSGKEPMGLLWSMRPVPGSRAGLRLRKMNVCSPMLVNISVYSGHLSEDFSESVPLASVLTERWYMAPGVKRINVQDRGVRGTLFIPPGPGPFPALLDMWGGGGGLIEYRSALLASHGYVSLALEYFKPGELLSPKLELNYFETAFNMLREHPQVVPHKVGLFGLSLGAIITIYLASESTVKPACCVGISGSHIYPRGKPLQEFFNMITRLSHKVSVDENNHHIWRNVTLPLSSHVSEKIDVTGITCPMLLVSGMDDQNQAAVECADEIAQMMQAAGKEHLLSRLEYPETGHLIEPPYSPHFRATNFITDRRRGKVTLLWGGQVKAHSDAQEDAWKKILSFLQQHLYTRSSPRAKM